MLKVGDKIKAKPIANDYYNVTNTNNDFIGKVIFDYGHKNNICVRVIHSNNPDEIGIDYDVDSRFFYKVNL